MVRSLILLLCLCSPLFSQTIQTNTEQALLTGIESFQQVGSYLLVPVDSKPVLEPVGFVEIETEAAYVDVVASKENREEVETILLPRESGWYRFLIRGSGKVWIDIVIVDFDLKIFKRDRRVIDITPPEPPKPAVDFQEISRTTAPPDPAVKNHLVRNITAVIESMPATVPEAVMFYKTAVSNALALRPRGDQNIWIDWRAGLEEAFDKVQPSSVEQLKQIYQEIVKGLQ